MCLPRKVTAFALAILVATPVLRAATPAAICTAAKRKAVAQKAFDEMKCHATAARRGTEVDERCLDSAEARFAETFARAEQKGGCVTVADEAARGADSDAFIADAVTALPSTLPYPCAPGRMVSDRCWYASALGSDCDSTCAAVAGTYDPATATFAGSEGSDANCLTVLRAFLSPPLPVSPDPVDPSFKFTSVHDCAAAGLRGLGCAVFVPPGPVCPPLVPCLRFPTLLRCATPSTTSEAFAKDYSRRCACRPRPTATDAVGRCAAAKRKAIGKHAFEDMKCYATAARTGEAVTAPCLERSAAGFAAAFARAERAGGCLPVGSGLTLEERVDRFVANIVAALPTGR